MTQKSMSLFASVAEDPFFKDILAGSITYDLISVNAPSFNGYLPEIKISSLDEI
jgi:hypothetical protein